MAGEAGESERLISRQRPRSFVRNWIAFFLLGTVNNLTFVIINSAAKTIVRDYHKESLIGLIPWASVALSFVARGANTLLLDRATYAQRIIANAVLMVVGLLGVAFANSFWLSLVAILISGASSSFGESCTLGYLRLYPSTLVNAWSSGTGMAGVGVLTTVVLTTTPSLPNVQTCQAANHTPREANPPKQLCSLFGCPLLS
eukprot:m.78288 g.78288  ORF g.78288 m.78288 type:complete len:201 (+) comp14578_c0_seq4:219-821(+)